MTHFENKREQTRGAFYDLSFTSLPNEPQACAPSLAVELACARQNNAVYFRKQSLKTLVYDLCLEGHAEVDQVNVFNF